MLLVSALWSLLDLISQILDLLIRISSNSDPTAWPPARCQQVQGIRRYYLNFRGGVGGLLSITRTADVAHLQKKNKKQNTAVFVWKLWPDYGEIRMSSFSGPEFAMPMNLTVCSCDKRLVTNVWPWMTMKKKVQITVISETQQLLSDLLMAYVQMDDSSLRTLVCIHFPSFDPAYGHNVFIIG